jgi:hypothetical protein
MLTPCTNVLIDMQYGASLISIFHGITFTLPEGTERPTNAVMPKEWAIYSKWNLEPEEYGKNYTSNIKIYWPDGTLFSEATLDAVQPTKDGMAFINRMNGFPVGQDGKLRILQTLESDGITIARSEEITLAINDPAHFATGKAVPIENATSNE